MLRILRGDLDDPVGIDLLVKGQVFLTPNSAVGPGRRLVGYVTAGVTLYSPTICPSGHCNFAKRGTSTTRIHDAPQTTNGLSADQVTVSARCFLNSRNVTTRFPGCLRP